MISHGKDSTPIAKLISPPPLFVKDVLTISSCIALKKLLNTFCTKNK